MTEETIRADVAATLTRLQAKHPELKESLEKCHGYAVFPSVGRASAVLGGAYGKGEVFESGKSVGFASLSQMTIGVQIGGQTFSELILFPKKEALDKFREGQVAFTANASAVIVKAAASGTTNFDGVTAHAYSRGGMLLEVSLGGQKLTFIPPETLETAKGETKAGSIETGRFEQNVSGNGEERAGTVVQAIAKRLEARGNGGAGGASILREAGARMTGLLREHPVAGTMLGMWIAGAGLAATALMARR